MVAIHNKRGDVDKRVAVFIGVCTQIVKQDADGFVSVKRGRFVVNKFFKVVTTWKSVAVVSKPLFNRRRDGVIALIRSVRHAR